MISDLKKLAKKILFNEVPDKGQFLYGKVLDVEEKIELTKEELDKKINEVSKLPGPKGDPGVSIKGDPGENYILTEDDVQAIASKIEVPVIEKLIEKTEVIHEQPIVEQKIEIKEVAVTDEPDVIAEKLNTLEKAIDASVIKGLLTIDDIKGKLDISDIKNGLWNQPGKGKLDQRWHGGGISSIVAGSGITAVDDGSGHITVSATGSTTDEKVKYDVNDPTAGYLGAKVVAGEGITISEGAGTDANKLKISNTWMLDPVEEYWDITTGLPVAPDVGDRYISDGTDEGLGWYDGYIYEWDGSTWLETLPMEGMMVWLIFEMVWWVFMSGGWREEGWDTYVNLDQTTPQTFTAGTVTGTGLLQVVGGVLGKNVMLTVSDTAPTSPNVGDLWIDIS